MASFSFPDLQPYLDSIHDSLPPQAQTYFTRQNIQLLLRSIVIISTYLLFRPQLERLFKKVTGTPDQREEELKARLEFLRQQKDGESTGATPKKSVGVVGKDGSVHKVAPSKQTEGQSPKKGKAKGGRKKA
ncbi:hypothetical protein H2200_003209 [Cladophialophora chaetospira]|uniref:Uncharacterized protein n=1 Tax=Cladophialophora chaetospira TaxID=386627 RepID=A0AA39CM25_9EURO|nr:hypothetical protein H2200_003209 [Cladophialophora chaetospira]